MAESRAVPTYVDVRRAASQLAGRAVRTPMLESPILDARVGGRVLFKCETLQHTGSFKFRGAFNALANLDRNLRTRGVVAVSSGNHAQGVAEAARLYGIGATIVMPADAPDSKRSRTERSGAAIVTYDRATEDRDAIAGAIVAEQGGTLIHPYDDPQVIAGQGTVGLEIVEDVDILDLRPDAVLVPCGGGGLSAGIGLAVRATYPETLIYAVEPVGFDDYARSLRQGKPVANPDLTGSVCDALMAPMPGALGFAINRVNLSGALAVTDGQALEAVAFAFRELKLVVEPGGAVGLAAILSGLIDCRGRTVVVVLSGGNIDAPVLDRALREH